MELWGAHRNGHKALLLQLLGRDDIVVRSHGAALSACATAKRWQVPGAREFLSASKRWLFFLLFKWRSPKKHNVFLGFQPVERGCLGPVFFLFWVWPHINIRWEKRTALNQEALALLRWFEDLDFEVDVISPTAVGDLFGGWKKVTSFTLIEVMVLLSMHVSGQRWGEGPQIHGEFDGIQAFDQFCSNPESVWKVWYTGWTKVWYKGLIYRF